MNDNDNNNISVDKRRLTMIRKKLDDFYFRNVDYYKSKTEMKIEFDDSYEDICNILNEIDYNLCECGSRFEIKNKNSHLKSEHHKEYMKRKILVEK